MAFTQVELVKSTIPGSVVNIGECGLFINVSNYLNLKQQVDPYTAFSCSFQSKPMSAYSANVPTKLFQNTLGLEYRVTPTEAFSENSNGWRANCRHSVYVNGVERLYMDIVTFYTGGTSFNPVNSFMAVFYNDSDQKYYACLCALYKDGHIAQRLYPNNFVDVTANMTGQILTSYDPYSTDDDYTPTGGYGDFDYTSEDETPPSLPSLSASNAGFVTLWNPTISEVGDLADYLWGPTFSVATWQKLWNDPMECLLSLGIVPVSPTTGTRTNIYFGNADTGIESAPITTQFVKADMGSMHIVGQSASYMDYAPYAKASIYLPYCGTYALDVDEIMDADLALEYHIDIYTGACVAYLTINNRTNSDESIVHNVMYQFTGNCLASIPVTSGDHSQLLQSLLFMGASIAATVATAGAGAASGGAIEGLAAEGDVVASSGALGAATAGSAINTVMSMKPNVMHSGNLSSTAGLLGGQKPFVTFTWSNLCRPEDEYQLVGMPIQKSGTLSDFEGFTIVSACHMDNILCTDAERSMIEQALGRGVII